jgi:hypothetical protein
MGVGIVGRIVRGLLVLSIALFVPACRVVVGEPPAAMEYRWGNEGPYQPYPNVRLPRPNAETRDFWLRAHPPRPDVHNAGVLVGEPGLLVSVEQNGKPLDAPHLQVFPLDDPTAPVDIHYDVDRPSLRPPEIRFGSESSMANEVIRRSLGDLAVGPLLVVIGLALLLHGVVRKYARAQAWLGVFSMCIGVIAIAELDPLLGGRTSQWVWDQLANGAIFLYPAAFARFSDQALIRGGDRALRILGTIGLALLFVSVPIAVIGLVTLARLQDLAFIIVLAGIVRVLWLVGRQALRGDQESRVFAVGFAIMVAIGLPDILGGLRILKMQTAYGPYGVLVLVVTLIVLVERRFVAQRTDLESARVTLERKVDELASQGDAIRTLNTELRHQVVERSRELAELLLGTSFREANLTQGELFAGRYRIVRPLGAGGMGAVYEAVRVSDDKPCALKVMLQVTSGAEAARFAREAEIAAKLDHPNLSAVRDVGLVDGRLYFVMDLVEGGSLESNREHFGDPAWALPLLAQIARGLAALHENGVVHRDLKPANVLLDMSSSAPVARICDFGIARLADAFGDTQAVPDPLAETRPANEKSDRRRLTQSGVMVGTPLYMPPEAARGESAFPGDVFSFGLVAYEMLTGLTPFKKPPMMLAMEGRYEPPSPLHRNGVPANVAAILARCFAADPTARPRATQLAEVLATS